MTIIIILM